MLAQSRHSWSGQFSRCVIGAVALLSGSAGIAAEGKTPTSALVHDGFEQIALRRTADNRFYLSGRLAGRRHSFLVDTGWSRTTVNRPGETASVTLGEIQLSGVTFAPQPARQERVLIGGQPAPFDVVLGLDFLRRHLAVLDCGTGRLFTRREAPQAEDAEPFAAAMKRAGFLAVELRLYENLALTCPASIEGHALELLVDSGAAWTCLDGRQAEAWGLKPQPSTTRLSGAGHTGTRSLAVAQVKSLRLGAMEIPRAMVGLVDLADWGLAQEGKTLGEVKGLLGGEILRAHSAVIDCGGLKLWLQPRARK
jgi:predicted aspartyl protease